MSLVTAVFYILAGTGTFSDGLGEVDESPPVIFYVAAGFYVIVSYLVRIKNKWIRLSLGVINALIILIFFQMWSGNPEVLTSPAGLSTKIVQVMLEIGLIYLIIKVWNRNRDNAEQVSE